MESSRQLVLRWEQRASPPMRAGRQGHSSQEPEGSLDGEEGLVQEAQEPRKGHKWSARGEALPHEGS